MALRQPIKIKVQFHTSAIFMKAHTGDLQLATPGAGVHTHSNRRHAKCASSYLYELPAIVDQKSSDLTMFCVNLMCCKIITYQNLPDCNTFLRI